MTWPDRPIINRQMASAIVLIVLSAGCRMAQPASSIEFTRIPKAAEGGPASTIDTIEGRAIGARPGQQIVLYARSGDWWVQPYADQPFTAVRADSTWTNVTHAGTEYAALLVEPGYVPSPTVHAMPEAGGLVVAVAITKGTPPFWGTWWFRLLAVLTGLAGILALYRIRMRQVARQLNLRFEERLAERTRIAQELHDTLLQGFVSASMQLHVATERLPPDSPHRAPLDRVQELMRTVIEEARNAVRGLRSPSKGAEDLEQAFSGIEQEFADQGQAGFKVIVEGQPRPVHPVIRDEVYRIGREAVVNAFRHSGAKRIEVELEYAPSRLRVLVRDDGRGIDDDVLRLGRDGHWGLSGMRERAERIGARLRVWSRDEAGTEVEMSIPGNIAFGGHGGDGGNGVHHGDTELTETKRRNT
jgi:signal transduction histidine kinase